MSTNKENTDVTTASPPLSPSFLFLYISLGLLAATYTMFNIFPDLKGMTLLSWNGVFKIILVVLAGLNPLIFFGLFVCYKVVQPLFDFCDDCVKTGYKTK